MANATSNTDLFEQFIAAIADAVAERLNGSAPAKSGKVKDTEPEAEADEATREEREVELTKKRITTLRTLAIEAGYPEADVKEADKETLVNTLLDDEFGADDDESDDEEDIDDDDADDADDADDDDTDDESDDDDDDDDDEDEEDDDDGQYTREELEAMSAPELKRLAKEVGWTAADMRGLDQDELIDLFLGESGDEADEDDEDEADEEDEDNGYDEATLKGMSITELRALAKEWEVTLPRKKTGESPAALKKRVIAKLMAS